MGYAESGIPEIRRIFVGGTCQSKFCGKIRKYECVHAEVADQQLYGLY